MLLALTRNVRTHTMLTILPCEVLRANYAYDYYIIVSGIITARANVMQPTVVVVNNVKRLRNANSFLVRDIQVLYGFLESD